MLIIGALGALVFGLMLGWPFAVRLSRWARDIHTDGTPGRIDLIGSIGVVVTSIPADGYGEVQVRVAGQPRKLHALATRPIPLGTEIFVIEAPSDTSVLVEPIRPGL
ncbi:hypothetical protein DMB66_50720 [Actinoplanes sp. ATCC 53533]|nr:hypothetical protein DMB66_50720 [Actinoplanes sp. ATCC 53533]